MMKIYNSSMDVVMEADSQRTNRFTIETNAGVYEVTVGNDSGDLYIVACTKSRLVVLPCGDYNCIQVSQQNV